MLEIEIESRRSFLSDSPQATGGSLPAYDASFWAGCRQLVDARRLSIELRLPSHRETSIASAKLDHRAPAGGTDADAFWLYKWSVC